MEPDVLEQLYRRHYGAALLYCTALCNDAHLAQDIAADAFVKAYLSLPDDIPSFRYWLLRVCKNLWIDHLRRQRHETSDEPLQYIADPVTPEITFLRSERSRSLWNAIAQLPPGDREILTLHYFSDISLQEIARVTGRSHTAVRQRMTRLRHTLKTKLEEQGYGYEL